MDIYWIKEKRVCGPSTVPDVISLVQMGELTPESLGWHAGCGKWLPLRELPALADFLHEAPPPGEAAESDAGEEPEDTPPSTPQAGRAPERLQNLQLPPLPDGPDSERVYLPGPMARCLARLVDSALYALLLFGSLYFYQVPYDRSLIPTANPLLWLPMVLLEALLLSRWGSTPGKALMGIRVSTFPQDNRPGFLRALGRSIIVFTLGVGMMYFPLLMLLMMALSYWRLRRFGITAWDARCSTVELMRQPSHPRGFVLALVILYVSFILLGACMRSWVTPMLDDIARESPEAAATLRRFLPEAELPPASPAPEPARQAEEGPPQLRI